MIIIAHLVKCYYCEKQFDTTKEEFIKVNARRYAHKCCANSDSDEVKQKKKIDDFYKYTKELFKDDFNFMAIKKQVEMYLDEPYKYTYEGMKLSLQYWYEIKKQSIDKSRGAIGIIPYIYNDAKKYFLDIYYAQQNNMNKIIYKTDEIIKIKIPKRQLKKKREFEI